MFVRWLLDLPWGIKLILFLIGCAILLAIIVPWWAWF